MRGQDHPPDGFSTPDRDEGPRDDLFKRIEHRLKIIEEKLTALIEQRVPQEYYSVEDAASILKKAPFTVREWCRHGRINAEKRDIGRGRSKEWMISHAEIERIKAKGILPLKK